MNENFQSGLILSFRRGVELKEHESDHAYRLLDRYAFPLMSVDWGADEEWAMIEAIKQFGLGNWADISDHVCSSKLTSY